MTTSVTTTIEDVQQSHLSLIEQAGLIDITSPETNDKAGEVLLSIRGVIKDIEAARLSITRPLDAAKAQAIGQERAATAPFKEAEQHLRGLMLGWHLEEERALAQERAALEAASSRAAMEGRQDDADQALEDLVMVPAKPQRAAGTSFSTHWSANVTDFAALVQAVAAGDSSMLAFLSPNQSALDAEARVVKGTKSTIPGVVFIGTPGISAGARR